MSQSGRSWVKVEGHSTKSGRSFWLNQSVKVEGPKVSKWTVRKCQAGKAFFLDRLLSSLMTVQFSFFRPFSFFLLGPSTFSLLDCPLRFFWTVHFGPFGPSTFSPHDRSVFFCFGSCGDFLSNRLLFDFRTVHFRRPLTLSLLDRPL